MKVTIFHFAMDPILFGSLYLYRFETRIVHVGFPNVYSDVPSRIIKGFYTNPVPVLPIAIALRCEPVLQPRDEVGMSH